MKVLMRPGVKIWVRKLLDILGRLGTLAALEIGVLGVSLWTARPDLSILFFYIVQISIPILVCYIRGSVLSDYGSRKSVGI